MSSPAFGADHRQTMRAKISPLRERGAVEVLERLTTRRFTERRPGRRLSSRPGIAVSEQYPGGRGSVKLKGQPERTREIIECVHLQRYTDRFYRPLGGRMDWPHSIEATDDGCEVTFDVSVGGPTAIILRPIMRAILPRELPPTVDKLVTVAVARAAGIRAGLASPRGHARRCRRRE